MLSFSPETTYGQDDTLLDDSREVIQFVLNHPNQSNIKGCPAAILSTIDEYARTKIYRMNVSDDKSKIVTNLIAENKPEVIVELGAHCGYSTILFSSAQQVAGIQHPKHYLLQRSPKLSENIKQLIEFAGLEDAVEIRGGPSDESIYKLHAEGRLKHIDLLFLDQEKPTYKTDLKLCEQLGLIENGTILIANNVTKSGKSPYLDYVRSTVAEKRTQLSEAKENDGFETGFGRSASQYSSVEKLGSEGIGNPNLIYETRLTQSWEPTGVENGMEITRCMGLDTS